MSTSVWLQAGTDLRAGDEIGVGPDGKLYVVEPGTPGWIGPVTADAPAGSKVYIGHERGSQTRRDGGSEMDIYKKHVDMLGLKVRDKVTGFAGVIESVSFDLYGCVQAVVRPQQLNDKGEVYDGRWFDVQRLSVEGPERVMPVPSFAALATPQGVHTVGPADKKPIR